MDSKRGNRIMIAVLAIGFFFCVAYALTSTHLHKADAAENVQAPAGPDH